jgi:hypothetical protein
MLKEVQIKHNPELKQWCEFYLEGKEIVWFKWQPNKSCWYSGRVCGVVLSCGVPFFIPFELFCSSRHVREKKILAANKETNDIFRDCCLWPHSSPHLTCCIDCLHWRWSGWLPCYPEVHLCDLLQG